MKCIQTEQIKQWARERDLHNADPHKQMLKLTEEVGEIAGALARGKVADAKSEIGDAYVVLTILSMQLDLDIKDCIESAYTKIKNRDGKMINGIFVKKDDLQEVDR